MTAMGPAANAILAFENEIRTAILQLLAGAESNLQAIDSGLKVAIASLLTPAITTTSKLANVVIGQISQQLAQANEYVASTLGDYQPLPGGATGAYPFGPGYDYPAGYPSHYPGMPPSSPVVPPGPSQAPTVVPPPPAPPVVPPSPPARPYAPPPLGPQFPNPPPGVP